MLSTSAKQGFPLRNGSLRFSRNVNGFKDYFCRFVCRSPSAIGLPDLIFRKAIRVSFVRDSRQQMEMTILQSFPLARPTKLDREEKTFLMLFVLLSAFFIMPLS